MKPRLLITQKNCVRPAGLDTKTRHRPVFSPQETPFALLYVKKKKKNELCLVLLLLCVKTYGVLLLPAVSTYDMYSLNPSCAKASRGLERLEKLMRGVDPDEDEGDMGGEDGAADTSASRVRHAETDPVNTRSEDAASKPAAERWCPEAGLVCCEWFHRRGVQRLRTPTN